MTEVEFNNGFVTALCLFYGHLADGTYEKAGVSDLRKGAAKRE